MSCVCVKNKECLSFSYANNAKVYTALSQKCFRIKFLISVSCFLSDRGSLILPFISSWNIDRWQSLICRVALEKLESLFTNLHELRVQMKFSPGGGGEGSVITSPLKLCTIRRKSNLEECQTDFSSNISSRRNSLKLDF